MKRVVLVMAVLAILFSACQSQPAPEPRPVRPDRGPVSADIYIEPGESLVLLPGDDGGPDQAIVGVSGERLALTDVVIEFNGTQLAAEIRPGTAVNWITNLPAGLRARVREARSGSQTVVLLVDGTPQMTLNAPMTFNIPGDVIQNEGQGLSFTSDQAKFEIRQGNIERTERVAADEPPPAYVYVGGYIDEEMEAVDLRVNLTATYLIEAIEEEDDATSWVTNIPEGLTATVNPAAAGAGFLILTIRGTPLEARNEAINVVVPASVLGVDEFTDVESFAVPNEIVWWRVLGGYSDSVVVDGSVGAAIVAKDLAVELAGATFASDIAPGQTINWITNMPAGLTLRAKWVRAGENVAIVTIAGIPTVVSTETLEVTIPAEFVSSEIVVPVKANVDARFSINDNTRQISYAEAFGDSTNPGWLNNQRGPLNVPILPSVKDFQGVGLVTATSTMIQRLGGDNQYHWTGNAVNYAMLIAEAQELGAHGIINVVIDYTDSVEYSQVIRELAPEHEWSQEEYDKISRGILREEEKDGVRYSIEESYVITRTYSGSALAFKYIDGLNFYDAEAIRPAAAE